MFLAAIVVASKFLQDRTYSNRSWSKISGLPTKEIEQLERVFLHTIKFHLVVDECQWSEWTKDLSARWNYGSAED
ncbi:PHO85 cyclin-5 [Malassezia sp. CBS 17886]|nr:PHO85 cyclin-5 [Malassezia sp. CBS 17886]